MSTEVGPNETDNDLTNVPNSPLSSIARDSHRVASQETVTKWDHERQLRQLRRDDD